MGQKKPTPAGGPWTASGGVVLVAPLTPGGRPSVLPVRWSRGGPLDGANPGPVSRGGVDVSGEGGRRGADWLRSPQRPPDPRPYVGTSRRWPPSDRLTAPRWGFVRLPDKPPIARERSPQRRPPRPQMLRPWGPRWGSPFSIGPDFSKQLCYTCVPAIHNAGGPHANPSVPDPQ